MKKIIVLVTLVFCGIQIFAQVSYTKRLEIDLKDHYFNERVTPFGELGFILTAESTSADKGMRERKYELYDHDLKLVDEETVKVDKRFLEVSEHDETRMHNLLYNYKGDFKVITFEPSTMEIIEVNGDLPKKMVLGKMIISGDYLIVKGYVKRAYMLVSINWKTGKINQHPVSIQNVRALDISISGLQHLKSANENFMFVNVIGKHSPNDTYVFKLNADGSTSSKINLTASYSEKLYDMSMSKTADGEYALTGTYSTDQKSSSAEGIFFGKITDDEVDFITTHSFLDLKEFLSYLPEKEQEKIEHKKERKESRGKEHKLSYNIAGHEVIRINSGFVFIGEAYYATYRTVRNTTTVNGKTTTTTEQVFDGYRYTHAVIAKFNEDGTLDWDKCFELYPAQKPFYVKRFISIPDTLDGAISMVFSSTDQITSKRIRYNGFVMQDESSETISTGKDSDEAKSSYSDLDYWYDDYFIAYGMQIIKNYKGDDKRKRKVYFVSKVKYQ